jgi:hypothetical protein
MPAAPLQGKDGTRRFHGGGRQAAAKRVRKLEATGD